ncbi:MAG: FAD-binding oxidoreductase [Bacteroidetes bacterium]|nr:FAD-binding oxidoreductase [Bacteroidota bacterium]
MSAFDYIVVGQGIAGSLLSWFLLQGGKTVLVIDAYDANSSSRIAGGLVNPITGRKFVKTWLADELLPFATSTYKSIEEQLGDSFYRSIPIVHVFDSIKQQNDWSVRCATAEYKAYLSNETILRFDSSKVNNELGAFEIGGAHKLDTIKFLNLYRSYLNDKGALLGEQLDYAALQVGEQVQYKDYTANKIIFCEGIAGRKNPYFNTLPFTPAKGECLHVVIENFYNDKVLKDEVAIMPIDGNNYYIGATHEQHFTVTEITDKGKAELEEKLRCILNSPYQITAHQAAVRPATKHRRPFVGMHPQHSNVGILNGLGTKGVSLAPYFAQQLVRHLLYGEAISVEVDIAKHLS